MSTVCDIQSFNVELSDVTGGAQIDRSECLVRILFDETASVVQFVRADYPFLENCETASVPVIRTRSTNGISQGIFGPEICFCQFRFILKKSFIGFKIKK